MMIAHRLETAVTYSDKIIVMDKGQVAEYDHSFALLVDNPREYLGNSRKSGDDKLVPFQPTKKSVFAKMVRALPKQ